MSTADPAAVEALLRWVGAAIAGRIDDLLERSATSIRSLAPDEASKARLARRLARRFANVDLDECSISARARLLGPNMESLILVTDPALRGRTFDSPMELDQDQGVVITLEWTGAEWLVAGWGGSVDSDGPEL